jgi:hypothetical protein
MVAEEAMYIVTIFILLIKSKKVMMICRAVWSRRRGKTVLTSSPSGRCQVRKFRLNSPMVHVALLYGDKAGIVSEISCSIYIVALHIFTRNTVGFPDPCM